MARRLTLDFLRTEAASGVILGGAAALAILVANSPWAGAYTGWLKSPFTIQVGGFVESMPVLYWIKHGLMAIFFFVVGLEIKHEVLRGELSNPRRLALPVLAALGGMAAPALVYLLANMGAGGMPQGWPIPAATDIAFALAALAVVGRNLPSSVRVFLLTLAIADDLGAVALIALLFSTEISWLMLGGAALSLLGLWLLSRWRNAPYLFYALGVLLVWGFTLKSGVSTSLGAVAAAFTIPLTAKKGEAEGVLQTFMHSLHPYVGFVVLPLFAFAAAGFSFAAVSPAAIVAPLPLGIIGGLVIGKQLGVFGAAWLAVKSGLARRPTGATWLELYGVSVLCGVGFTMSLFIGGLAFPANNDVLQGEVRLGVVAGSILAIVWGSVVLSAADRRRKALGGVAPPALI